MLPKPTPKLRIRGMILTAGIAAVTVVGTFFGANLKTEREVEKMMAEPAREDDIIAALETRRRGLEQAKLGWEKKAQALRERVESNSQRSVGGGGNASNSAASSGK